MPSFTLTFDRAPSFVVLLVLIIAELMLAPLFAGSEFGVHAAQGVGSLILVAALWTLPLALAVTVLVSSYLIHIQTFWRQAPITAAIVIATGVTHHSRLSGVENGLHKVGEVLLGCVMGLVVSWIMSRVWPLPEVQAKGA